MKRMAVAIAFVLALASMALAVSLGTATDYAAVSSAGPTSVATSDLRSVGKLDMVVTNSNTNNVSVLLGNGDGTFSTHVEYATGSTPYCVVVADMNKDGKPDLVVANQISSGSVSVLLGNGDGTFGTHTDYGAGAANPETLCVGDFDGDGNLDVAVALLGGGFSVLLGDGTGALGTASLHLLAGHNPVGIATADFNGDGKLDLVVALSDTSSVIVVLGVGDGTFTGVGGGAPTTGPGPYGVAVGDLRNNGKIDIVTGNSGDNTISVLLGNGDGTFATHIDYTAATEALFPVLGDFDGSGKLGVAVNTYGSSTVNELAVFLGNGDGTLGTVTLSTNGHHSYGCAVADFNGDGKLDFATANFNSDNVTVWLQTTSGYRGETPGMAYRRVLSGEHRSGSTISR